MLGESEVKALPIPSVEAVWELREEIIKLPGQELDVFPQIDGELSTNPWGTIWSKRVCALIRALPKGLAVNLDLIGRLLSCPLGGRVYIKQHRVWYVVLQGTTREHGGALTCIVEG